MVRRGRLAQGLVRPLVVVPVQVGVEDSLLPGRGGRDGLEGLLVQGAVEPLEAAVLFGVSRLDALRDHAELDEPDGELTQAAEGGAGERRAVVGADDEGESILAEGALEDGTDLVEGGTAQRLTGEQVTGAGVLDGEGVDADAVAGADPALEVGAPAVVGVDGLLEGVVPRGRAAPTPPAADETGPIEDGARGAGSGPAEEGIGGSEEGDQLLGAEAASARLAWIRRLTTSWGVALWGARGARLRSRRPSAPAARKRLMNLWAVLRLTPKWWARAATVSSPSCQAAMKASRSSWAVVFCQGNMVPPG